jgi:Kef-type K+ transport system membrane component KefB
MNTRGLMELVVLNIGYELGIISPALYTMMVVMALATTCMAGPMLSVVRQEPFKTEGSVRL